MDLAQAPADPTGLLPYVTGLDSLTLDTDPSSEGYYAAALLGCGLDGDEQPWFGGLGEDGRLILGAAAWRLGRGRLVRDHRSAGKGNGERKGNRGSYLLGGGGGRDREVSGVRTSALLLEGGHRT